MDSSTASEDFYREDGIMNKISVPSGLNLTLGAGHK
jgi:hypothetical protein